MLNHVHCVQTIYILTEEEAIIVLANWYSVLIQGLLGERILLQKSKRAFNLFYKADCRRLFTEKQHPLIEF